MSYDKPIRRIAIVGTGVIGASWAAEYLARGFDVVATDPAPNAESNLRKLIDEAWEDLTSMGLSKGASRDELHRRSGVAPERLVDQDDRVPMSEYFHLMRAAETLTATLRASAWRLPSTQLAASVQATRSTHSPIGTIRPISSAMGMNSAGATNPLWG